jgi:glycogen(starch) synthase
VHVHTNGHNRGSWRLAWLCSLGHFGPSLLTLHSGLAPDFVRSHKSMVRDVCARYRATIAVNPAIGAALVDAGVDAKDIVVCPAFTPSALALRVPPPGLEQLRRAHSLLVACALAPGPEYGAMVMLDAFQIVHSHNKEAGLILYGPGTRDPALAAAARARGLDGVVHFLGELPRERALAVVDHADVFVRPTLADGDAISVREALALGRPAVASAVGMRPPSALLFTAGDAAACAELIFHAVAQQLPEDAPTVDCLPALLAIYRRLGAPIRPVAIGTALATAT